MPFLTITLYVWLGLLVAKLVGFPLVREITWGQLFFVPVAVALVRLGVVFFSIVAFVLGFFFLLWFTGFLADIL